MSGLYDQAFVRNCWRGFEKAGQAKARSGVTRCHLPEAGALVLGVVLTMRLSVVSGALAGLFGMCGPMSAHAQNTSGVFSPVVDEGERSAQYRLGFDPDGDALAQRFHYQEALNGELRWRFIGQFRRTDGSDVDFDFARLELLWQVTPDDQAYQSALRFEARYRSDDRPGDIGVLWTNQWPLGEGWRLRLIGDLGREIGSGADDGFTLGSRAEISRKLDFSSRIGVQLFSDYGTTEALPGFDEQEHELGPVASFDVGEDWSLVTGALFGLTDASADAQFRLWVSRDF